METVTQHSSNVTLFPHQAYHGIRSEMIITDGLVVRNVEYFRPSLGVI